MSKFNETEKKEKVKNYMGGRAFKQTPKEELVFAVLTTFIEDSYYESKNDRVDRIKSLVKTIVKKDPEFVAKLAIYTRKRFYMRSAFHLLIDALSEYHKGDSLVSQTIMAGVMRVDDLTEIVASLKSDGKIPNQVKKGISGVINKFNAYQFAKYKGSGKKVKLVDLFNIAHPKPSDMNVKAFKQLMKGELKNTETWESKLSAGEEKGNVFKNMIEKGEIGYMALLRNLRNILQTCDETTIEKAIEMLTNKEAVKKSKQLPFRFLSAYKEIESIKNGETKGIESRKKKDIVFEKEVKGKASKDSIDMVLEAIEKALMISIENLPLLDGKTVILSDNSGSMRGDSGGCSAISAMSKRTTADIANLFAAMYWSRCENTYVGLFGDRLISPKMDREKGLFDNYDIIDEDARKCGPSTEEGIFNAFTELIKRKEKVGRIIIFSDCQVCETCVWYDTNNNRGNDLNKLFEKYRTISPETMVYSVDLKGYGNTMFAGNVVKMSGWSEKIFQIMEYYEKGNSITNDIEALDISQEIEKNLKVRNQQ